jgi:serine/threonine protein phosphatase PrpC
MDTEKEERRKKNKEYLKFTEEYFKENKDVHSVSDISKQKTVLLFDDSDTDNKNKFSFDSKQILNSEEHKNYDYCNLKTEIFLDDMPVSIGSSSVIGKREYQQDSLKVPDEDQLLVNGKPKFVCVLSDGMGGLSGGELASNTVTKTFFDDYYSNVWNSNDISYMNFFSKESDIINEKVLDLSDENGNSIHAGATLIAVAVDDDNMHFLNIGDSRIFLIRKNKILQLTHDQNYLSVLMEKVANGEITVEEAITHPKREALVSYCGIKSLKIKEINLNPVKIKSDDVILMCSDGLYRLINEQEMVDIVYEAYNDMNLAAYKLTAAANNKNSRSQDNTSVILIKIN